MSGRRELRLPPGQPLHPGVQAQTQERQSVICLEPGIILHRKRCFSDIRSSGARIRPILSSGTRELRLKRGLIVSPEGLISEKPLSRERWVENGILGLFVRLKVIF